MEIIYGSVRQADGGMMNPGSGKWKSRKLSTGRYKVEFQAGSSQAPIVITTPVDDHGGLSSNNIMSTYNHEHTPPAVYVVSVDAESGQIQDGNFSFVAYVQ